MDDRIARLLDRQEIQDLLLVYARAVDRRDWETVRTVFHPDAHDDHGDYRGGVDGFLAWVTERHARIGQSMHFLGNCLIEFTGRDTAAVETYYIAMQRLGDEAGAAQRAMLGGKGGAIDVDVLGRYVDRIERRDGAWKIASRVVTFEEIRTRPADGPPLGQAWAQQSRDFADPVYKLRRSLGLTDRG